MGKKRKGTIARWKSKGGKTNTIRAWWCTDGKWWVVPTIHYEHVFDPLTITFHFLKFNVAFHRVMRMDISEFKKMLERNGGFDPRNVKPGYFEV